jgi:hypothetical protein
LFFFLDHRLGLGGKRVAGNGMIVRGYHRRAVKLLCCDSVFVGVTISQGGCSPRPRLVLSTGAVKLSHGVISYQRIGVTRDNQSHGIGVLTLCRAQFCECSHWVAWLLNHAAPDRYPRMQSVFFGVRKVRRDLKKCGILQHLAPAQKSHQKYGSR